MVYAPCDAPTTNCEITIRTARYAQKYAGVNKRRKYAERRERERDLFK